jgi:hypothetical protein
MDIQKTILNQYMLLNNRPTFKEIARDTGIQVTRVFRLYNGSTMKLSEYQIFNKKVKEKMGLTGDLSDIAFECSMKLSPESIKDLEVYLKRRIQLWTLTQIEKQSQSSTYSA